MEGIFWLIVAFFALYFLCRTPDHEFQGNTVNENLICPHCHTKGKVSTKQVKVKQGISGGKATAGILTCGITLLGTGLSRKNQLTEAHCNNCGSTWRY